jgi:hypothetical protein
VVRHPVTEKPLQLSLSGEEDLLVAVEFGAVIDGKPEEETIDQGEGCGFFLDEPGGTVVGFWADKVSRLDPNELAGPIWEGPRFDVPVLGLRQASAGEIILSAQATFAGVTTVDNVFFDYATTQEDPERAELGWRICLAAGSLKAHFALGYTLCDLGRFHEAYRHLRLYAELCLKNSWAWCWFGKACVGKGELGEAHRAFERAIELEEAGSFETDAQELLAGLSATESERA